MVRLTRRSSVPEQIESPAQRDDVERNHYVRLKVEKLFRKKIKPGKLRASLLRDIQNRADWKREYESAHESDHIGNACRSSHGDEDREPDNHELDRVHFSNCDYPHHVNRECYPKGN